jgi:hypothetical protein
MSFMAGNVNVSELMFGQLLKPDQAELHFLQFMAGA